MHACRALCATRACHGQPSRGSPNRMQAGCSTRTYACTCMSCAASALLLAAMRHAICSGFSEPAVHTMVGVGRCVRRVQQHSAGALKILLLLHSSSSSRTLVVERP